MQQFKILVLTDHTNHSVENSLYALVQTMRFHPRCAQIDVATRGNSMNNLFFHNHIAKGIYVTKVDESFEYSPDGKSLNKNLRRESIRTYDAVWLRLPPPLSNPFLDFLIQEFPNQLIFNAPSGIKFTGSKKFLLEFPEICPPMKICKSIEDIISFKKQFPLVLKPLQEYGGNGLVKIEDDKVWEGNKELDINDFWKKIKDTNFEYLAVKYLKNVTEGDKRIIVVNGKILGASLRLPSKDSWICNVAMGGSSNYAKVDEDEQKIITHLNPRLSEMGIVMYGVDTLKNDDGKRVLSEINTISIGGLPQIAKMENKPLVKEATDLIWMYVTNKILNKNDRTN